MQSKGYALLGFFRESFYFRETHISPFAYFELLLFKLRYGGPLPVCLTFNILIYNILSPQLLQSGKYSREIFDDFYHRRLNI